MTERRLLLRNVKTGEEYGLTGVVPVGREADDGIKLIEDGASRKHASLSVIDGVAYVEDLGSRNGTSLNSRPLTVKTALKSGDRIKFDTEEFVFHVDGGDATVAHPPIVRQESPGSWAEVKFNEKGTDGTERFDPNQLKEYLEKVKERQERLIHLDIKEPCLRVSSDGQEDRTIPLKVDGSTVQEWTIGRSPDSAVRLDAGDVSERHAKLVRQGAQWKLVDALSSNGTYVNGLRIGMCYLTAGDALGFGTRIRCEFNLPSKRSARGSGGKRAGLKKVFLIGLAISFLATLVILYLLFRP
jgi:pSer/pThr/pTyr-binding forkhead associated (FHA) protein